MQYQYYMADVFTNTVFNGAQVAVFPDARGLTKAQMAVLARELNLSETVFVVPAESADITRRLYTFTPNGELDFAGHPLIAAAFVLASCGEIELTGDNTPVVLEQNFGAIEVNISSDQGEPVFVQFTREFSSIVDRFAPTDTELASILSIEASHIDSKTYMARLVFCGAPYLIVPILDYQTVRSAKFNFNAWSQSIAPQTTAQEILLFSAKNPHNDVDFNARLVGSKIGLYEDPPVGSAMPAFAAYLCSHSHVREGTYTFTIDRGDEQNRRSVLNLEMDKKSEQSLNLRIGGEAVMVAQGSIQEPV
jgi:trans-2,3-dihydro-3-hydroxyanthranilate isomerase